MNRQLVFGLIAFIAAAHPTSSFAETRLAGEHPRLYFSEADLPKLRELRNSGVHARIWSNVVRSADWCAAQPVRTEWIPTIADDPQYENLYDRFYAAMHDAAIVEHLALTSALSDSQDEKYFEPAKNQLLGTARVWKHEAANPPDASKAYAVLRVVKAMSVGYDALFPRLSEDERHELQQAIAPIATAYYNFFQSPTVAGPGYNKHHGSVDAAPFGVIALALLGDVEGAQSWLDLAVQKHVQYLLPHALTPSGTNDQSSNFWASTLQYRILFLDPLRRVTGRDLFAEFPDALPGQMALAAVAGGQPRDLLYNESNRSVLFAPCYGQIDYWSPAMIYLARQQRRPIYQLLALWDESLGSVQRTRFITPTRKEELLFCFGPYAYWWYDASVAPAVEEKLPHSFLFPEPEVSEAYVRASYERGGIVAAVRRGALMIHAGGRPVLVEQLDTGDSTTPARVNNLLVTDDGRRAVIRCVGPEAAAVNDQRITLTRPSHVRVERQTSRPVSWWYAGEPQREPNSLLWPDGTRLNIVRGSIARIVPDGFVDKKVHFGGMKFADPHPFVYPVVAVEPADGTVVLEIETRDR